jgi:hypothetical protein
MEARMSDLEIVMGVALCVLLWAWRVSCRVADKHYYVACAFREGMRQIVMKEVSVSYDEEEDELTVKDKDGNVIVI